MTPLEREQAIEAQGEKIKQHMRDGDKKQAQICFHVMMALIAGRDAETVERMEQERGLG